MRPPLLHRARRDFRIGIPACWLVLTGLLFWLAFSFPSGHNINRISADAAGYYGYLPAVFIYGNFTDLQADPLQFPRQPGSDMINLKTTCGVAMLQAPFFGVAHLIASRNWFGSKNPDGYSGTYSDAVVASSIVYTVLGLALLFQMLVKMVPARIALLTLVLLLFGSPLYFYAIGQAGMSHPYSFFLFALVMWFTPRFYRRPQAGAWLLMGALLGLATLVRLTNALIFLYPLLYQVGSSVRLPDRLGWYLRRWYFLLLAAVPAALIWVPQFLYWKHLTGEFWFYSYGEEGFRYLTSPKLWQVLFDVQNGYFLYSPIMLLPVMALVWLAWRNQLEGRSLLLIMVLATYLIASWWAWWFGAAFGHRAFVEYGAVLAIPFTWALQQWQRWPTWSQAVTGLLMLAAVYYSVGMGYLYRPPWDGPDWTWATWWDIVLQLVDP